MILFRFYTIFGLILLLIGIVFDFLFVQSEASKSFRTDPTVYLNSFKHQLYSLTKFYMIVLGFLNITLALLSAHLGDSQEMDWVIFGSMIIGSMLLIGTGFWYANAGPSFKWETRCTFLTIGLFAVLVSLGLEIYKVFSIKNI